MTTPNFTPPIIQYYTFSQDTGITVTKEYCDYEIRKIIGTYSRESIFRTISYISINSGLSNNLERILNFQNEYFKLPFYVKKIAVHRQATLAIIQFIIDMDDSSFSGETNVSPRDIMLLYTLVNEFLGFFETVDYNISPRKKIFFTSLKIYHFTSNENDLLASFELFKAFYSEMIKLEKKNYQKIIKEKLDIDIADYITIMQLLKDHNYPDIFKLFDKYAVINLEKIHEAWIQRDSKFEIPFSIPFLRKYPLVKIGQDYLLTDSNNLLSSISRNIYELLCQEDYEGFKSAWGKDVVEPVIKSLLREELVDSECIELVIGTNKYEFGDFGLLYKDIIFLFEIKTSVINSRTLFTPNYDAFIKFFDDKFVLKEGANQQLKKLVKIEEDYDGFCNLTNIDPNKKYTIYPVLLVFDEVLQSFCVDWYISIRFEYLKRIHPFYPKEFMLSRNHITITLNELYKLKFLKNGNISKLLLIKQYADLEERPPYSFSMFLQHINAFKN